MHPRPLFPRGPGPGEALTCGQQVSERQQHQEPMLASGGALPWASHSRHQERVGATPCPWCSPRAEPTDMTRTPSPGPSSQVAEFWRVSNVPGWPNPSEAGWGWEGPLLLFPKPDWLPRPLVQPVWFPGRQGPVGKGGRGSRPAQLPALAGFPWPIPRPELQS